MLSADDVAAWFFDLGGTLVEIEGDEVALTEHDRVIPRGGAIEALTRLAGRKVFVLSNQAAVARGTLPALQIYGFVDQINRLCGGAITDFRFAMHPPEAGHPWRKPAPGMVLDLALVYGLELARCVLIGDSASDQACARNAGVGRFLWIDEFLEGQS